MTSADTHTVYSSLHAVTLTCVCREGGSASIGNLAAVHDSSSLSKKDKQQILAELDERKRKMLREVEVFLHYSMHTRCCGTRMCVFAFVAESGGVIRCP